MWVEVRSGSVVKLSLGTTLFLRALKLFLLDYRRGTFRLRSQAEQLQSSAPELLAIAGTYVEWIVGRRGFQRVGAVAARF